MKSKTLILIVIIPFFIGFLFSKPIKNFINNLAHHSANKINDGINYINNDTYIRDICDEEIRKNKK